MLIVVLVSIALGVSCAPSTGVTVEWTTATETHTAGFNVSRADSSDGPFTRINTRIVPGSPDPLHGGKYQYLDTSADPAHTYYYKLEEVEDDGHTNLYGPILVRGDPLSGFYVWLVVGIGIIIISGLVFIFRRKTA